MAKLLKAFFIFILILVLLALFLGLSLALYVEIFMEKEIDEGLFSLFGSSTSSQVYYYDFEDRENREGELKLLEDQELFGGYRSNYVEFGELPQDMIDAFVSIEDKRFFSHSGVDWKRTLSAGVNFFFKLKGSFGGSTITQQLIKNVTDNDEYSFQRKLQEILWALDLETKLDKKEILECYLNIINLSHGYCGNTGTLVKCKCRKLLGKIVFRGYSYAVTTVR